MTKKTGLDFFVDKLTNSIENVQSGDNFPTEVTLVSRDDLKTINRKSGWQFDWQNEAKYPAREIFKLSIVYTPSIIQGIVSLESKKDHVFMHLIESAPFNIGRHKTYLGVPGNLTAFACKLSFQRGGEGYVSFLAKSKLIGHYEETLGAKHVGGQLMVINPPAALLLMNRYF